jgi:hypothetical protein
VPLFEEISDDWAYLSVERLEPMEDRGYLGQLPIDADQEAIRGQFGGGKFIVRAKTSQHQVKTQRTVEIAGDPIFSSDDAEARYMRRQGGPRLTSRAAPPAAPPIGIAEILGLMQTMQQQASQQLAQQLEAQRQERERQAAEDRRREDQRREEDRRRDEERRREEDRRESRRAEELEAARSRDREHVQTILGVVTSTTKQQGSPIEPFMQGLTLALKLGGRGDDDEEGEEGEEKQDPIVATVRAAIQGIGEALGKKNEPAAAAAPAASEEDVRFTGQLGEQVKALVSKAKERGQDPEKLIASAVQVLHSKLDKKKIAPPPTPPPASGATVTDLASARSEAAKKFQQAAAATHPAEPSEPPAS